MSRFRRILFIAAMAGTCAALTAAAVGVVRSGIEGSGQAGIQGSGHQAGIQGTGKPPA